MARFSISFINRDRLIAALMLLPSVILLAVFVYGFIGQTAYSSMTDWEGMAENVEIKFIGLENYRRLFTGLLEVRFRQAIVNNLFFTLFFMLGCLVLGLGLAILIDQRIQFEGCTVANPLYIPETGKFVGTRATVPIEIAACGDELAAFAGGVDILASTAIVAAKRIAVHARETAAAST